MNREELLDAFAEMPSADQTLVRAELIRSSHYENAPGAGSAVAACLSIMDGIRAGGDPIAVCWQMLEEVAGICPS